MSCYFLLKVAKQLILFSEDVKKWTKVLSTWILLLYHRYWDNTQEGISAIIARCFFHFPYRKTGKTWFYYFWRVNLNEIQRKCQMIFQLSIAGSTSIHEKNHLKDFLFRSIEELSFFSQSSSFYNHYKEFHALS